MSESEKIRINEAFNKEPMLGIFPLSQAIPIAFIVFTVYFICGAIGLDTGKVIIISLIIICAWLYQTRDKPHLTIDRLKFPPANDYINAQTPYISIYPENRDPDILRIAPPSRLTVKEPLRKTMINNLKKGNFAPLINFQHLVAPVAIEKDNKIVGGFFLEKNNLCQIVFVFDYIPPHESLDVHTAEAIHQASKQALDRIPANENIRFYIDKYSNYQERNIQQTSIAKDCQDPIIRKLFLSNCEKTKQLSQSRQRQVYSYKITATYSWTKTGVDLKETLGEQIIRGFQNIISLAAESQDILREEFFSTNFENAYSRGFQEYYSLFDSIWNLDVKPLNHHQAWQWLWFEFNGNSPAPTIPNYLYWNGNEFKEVVHSSYHALTVLLNGHQRKNATPKHRKLTKELQLPGRNSKIALLSSNHASSDLELNPYQQVMYLHQAISREKITDTKFVIEISHQSRAGSKEKIKQYVNSKSSFLQGEIDKKGGDIYLEEDLARGLEAQRDLSQGNYPCFMSMVAVVYRETSKALDSACLRLQSELPELYLGRELDQAYALWLETLPIVAERLLQTTSGIIKDRRLSIPHNALNRFIPVAGVHPVDRQGLELIAFNGMPVYLDLHKEHTRRILIIGEAGSGKSVMAWGFILQARADNRKVIVLDASIGAESSFTTAVKLCHGSHINTAKSKFNLLGIPDLRAFKDRPQELDIRLNRWKDATCNTLVSYIMFGIDDALLEQRVDSLVVKTLNVFLSNPDIRTRFQRAFKDGWQSEAWQKMPVLKDWLDFCTKEKLNLREYEDIDKRALNQIRTQIKTLLETPLGQKINSPSDFDPEVDLFAFTITNLTKERDQNLVAQVVQTTCLKVALSAEESVIVGDEMADLLKKKGFSSIWGSFHAMARKTGISLITISQTIKEIAKSPAAADIFDNISFTLIGKITAEGAESFIQQRRYPPEIIYRNASDNFGGKKIGNFTPWLLEKKKKFWQLKFYPSDLNLAILANSKQETVARNKFIEHHQDTYKGIKAFAKSRR